MFYEWATGHGLPHDPMKAIVSPRPIGWISSRSRAGDLNLAPYSFFGALSTKPPLIWFASEGEKDSVTFIRETGEFVASLVTLDLAEKMNATSVDAPRGINEFELAGLTPAPSRLVAPPRVAEAHAALECKVTEIRRPVLLDGLEAGVTVVTGQVVGVHIDDSCLTDGLFDSAKAQNLARLGYMDYAAVERVFQMRRPRWG
jgi:flavin reductase (DIM6/NTAB) family NADH-FMN oxidoreductase RutF